MSVASPAGSDEIAELNAIGTWTAYLDLSYPANFNSGEPHPWRSKLTTNRLSQFSPNMGMIYFRREASEASPFGLEIGAQGGYDTDGQVPATSQLAGAEVLRYLSHANVSYRAPVGNGLLLTGGLMSSFIGYESFYARDNPNYTRSWIADYSPFFLIGAGAQYRISDGLDASLFIVSDFDYLAHHNNHPKYAGQISWRIGPGWKLTQNVFAGPEQTDTAIRYWRFFSDSILQWTDDVHAIGLAYDVGTQQEASLVASVQNFWTGAALFTRWQIQGPWALAIRPELYWDPNGTLTGSIQFIRALTATVEYAIVADGWTTQLRAEYRYDNSTGRQGGFFGAGGTDGPLVSGQSTVLLAVLISLDRP
ncbi:outer membrane beta-barrel protein [Methylotetracoccus oryzae]|uniref:outer membrane beta-barrel protein n=1 Tax=Methylotetracoccus oryzae TaxID=1919059 RepID=UPI0013A5B97E|nr:outer membrane beta-barrel protein [Methylotetracoccus oryzae]